MLSRSLRLSVLFLLVLNIFKVSGKEYYFKHYDITNGLSQNTVHKIHQDRMGFMWFATKDGLNRFDGKNFRRVDTPLEEGKASYISTLFEDSNGQIWVGTHNGPYVYSPESENLNPLKDNEGRRNQIHSSINDFAELSDGRILIAVENMELCIYNPKDQSISFIENLPWEKTSSVMSLCHSSSGNIFIGTFRDGLFVTDKTFRNIKKVTGENDSPYFDNCVINVIKKKGDKIFIGTDNKGLHIFDETTGTISPVIVKDENGKIPFIRDINFNKGPEIVLATESGLYIYDLADKEIKTHLIHDYFDPYSISDDAIYSVYFDNEGGLWIGSYFGGIDYQGNQQPEFIKYVRKIGNENLQSERIRELCMDSNGNVYVGSEDHGLSLFNPSSGKFLSIPGVDEKNIHGLCFDGENLWIGTFSQGLIIYNTSNHKIKRYNSQGPNGLVNDYIFSICRTKKGDIYIGTFNGLQRYDKTKDSFESIDDFHGLFIYNIKEDKNENLWVSTYSNGLFLKKSNESGWVNFMENESDPQSIPSNKIYSVQEDSMGNIWIMTQNGACVYNNGIFDTSAIGVDRIPGVVYRIEEDDQGKYWLSSNHGIFCIDPQTKNIWNFTVKDGLTTNQFNYNSSLKTPEGKLFFGSIDGLIFFDPKWFVPEYPMEIKPVITELYIHSSLIKPEEEGSPLSKSISLTDRLELEPWQNSFAFNVSNLSYNNSGSQRIKYRLHGYDDEWKITDDDDDLINYSNINPGRYNFEAIAVDGMGNPIGPQQQLAVIINVPLYKRWWAILIYVIVGLTIAAFIYSYRRKYSRLSNERYLEKYKHEKERELFDSKINFFTNVAHEIRTPLTLIKAPLDSVSKHSDVMDNPGIRENLKVVNLNVDRLLQLTNQLLDFRKMESGNYIITRKECDIKSLVEKVLMSFKPTIDAAKKKIEINLPDQNVTAAVDDEAVTKIISNLINNAVKYGDSYVKLTLEGNQEGIVLKIANDGKIISDDEKEKIFTLFTRLDNNIPGTGIGLAFARNLALMHGGSLTLEGNDKENVFVLKLPKGIEDISLEDDSESDLDKIVKNAGDNENVLIVEDNPGLLSFLQKQLISNNYKVFTATTGKDALSILNDQHIDIVVSDIMMPEMDGHQLLLHIKENIRYSHIPVILLTAKTNLQDKLDGLEAGADYYIEKPFSMEYLLVSIASLLRNRNRIRHKIETKPLEKITEKGLTKTDEEFLKKLNDIITANFSNPDFSVDEIIGELGMGSTTFYRKVKGLLNLNPHQYIKLQRLKEAARLFQEGYTSVSEVCYLVGFSSPGYFARCFHAQFGIQPKDYIKGKL